MRTTSQILKFLESDIKNLSITPDDEQVRLLFFAGVACGAALSHEEGRKTNDPLSVIRLIGDVALDEAEQAKHNSQLR